MKVFIINGGQNFAHSGGKFQKTLTQWSVDFFGSENKDEVKVTDINNDYDLTEEVGKYVWADLVIYHVPVWWFHVPYKLKEYIDKVFSEGHKNGIYESDGRSRSNSNPKLHYGTGGLLHGRKYMLTTSWNAPVEAFTIPGEFFNLYSEDQVLMGVHKLNEFTGMKKVNGFHFHDMEKDVTPEKIEQEKELYLSHLRAVFHS